MDSKDKPAPDDAERALLGTGFNRLSDLQKENIIGKAEALVFVQNNVDLSKAVKSDKCLE